MTRDHVCRARPECPRAILPGNLEPGKSMMGSEGWPLDAESAVMLVARVVQEVDTRSEEGDTVLLADFLCAAWPTRWAQDQ